MEVSNLFVCLMGMGVTFLGLSCIICLTILMGRVMTALEGRRHAPIPSVPAAATVPSAVQTAPTDGLTDEIKVAILACLAQEPGFRMENVLRVEIRRR